MKILTILLLPILLHLNNVFCGAYPPFTNYCRFKDTEECVGVDIWFRKYEEPRMYPMECSEMRCPKGTYCQMGKRCWQEVKLDYKWKEMRFIDGNWVAAK
uniref:Uncharacterized protein n=1 Tax=Caenorhabditis japonica TaxID=281687 RepID=A0A8R1EQA7_CAEJA